jgi:hypothetical protein
MPDYLDRSEEIKIEVVDHLPDSVVIIGPAKFVDMI